MNNRAPSGLDRILFLLATVALVIAAAGAFGIWEALLGRDGGVRPFDAEVWSDWSCCDSTARYEMVSDIQRRLAGMSEAEAVSMLGPSEAREEDLHFFMGCGRRLVYKLGLEPGWLRLDPNHLVVRIVEGRVESTIVQ